MDTTPWLELHAANYPEWRDDIAVAEASGDAHPRPPRSYPGYPQWPLDRPRRRWGPSLDSVLLRRRTGRTLPSALPSQRTLGRLLMLSHGITGPLGAGPTPSAGGMQSLEIYAVVLTGGWLPTGAYHYDRAGHHLSQVLDEADGEEWRSLVPSLAHVDGECLLWILIGDEARTARKYGDRSTRFLLQEAGHLMQNMCLAAVSVGLGVVPLGGYFEGRVARRLNLPESDRVLYVGVM